MPAIVISSGHSKFVRGAEGPEPWGLDEVDEARRVVEKIAEYLRRVDYDVTTYHDDISQSQSENLERIVDFHNSRVRDLDLSVHFNAFETTDEPMGCEVLYVTQDELADEMSATISAAGMFPDRGGKYRSDLKFLNATSAPALLAEICFVDSSSDAQNYRDHFANICRAIASMIAGVNIPAAPTRPELPERPPHHPPPLRPDRPPLPPPEPLLHTVGACSWFGGPADSGVSSDEGLAFIYDYEDAPHLFLPEQPEGTTGLARRLNPDVFYVACRWDYDITPKTMLADSTRLALIRAGNRVCMAWPADWGPHEDTGRVADLSPGVMEKLGIDTDDKVEVVYPILARAGLIV